MLNTRQASASQWLFVALAALTLYRILSLLQPHMVLFYDEAQYYHWALNPDWGYYSKPPMVAWCIALVTAVLGDSVFAIKLAAPILYAATALVIYRIGRDFYSQAVAKTSTWVFITSTLVGYNSLFITTDAPLLFFWAATLWAFMHAMANNNWKYWVAAGVFCGAGMLSKYTMAALPGSLFLYMLVEPSRRGLLAKPGPWIAAIIAGVLFSGNLIWNATHDFMAFRHTSEISGIGEGWLHPGKLLEFVAAQFLVFGPVWAALWVRLVWRQRKSLLSPQWGLLHFATLPLLSVIFLQALLSHAYINWAGPVFIGASLLVGAALAAKPGRIWLWGGLLNLLLLSTFYHWPILADRMGLERTKFIDPWFRVLGWDQVGEQLLPVMQANPDLLLASSSRKLLATLGYYATPGEFRVSRWNPDANDVRDYYDQMANLRMYQGDLGQEFLWVSETPAPPEFLLAFASAELSLQISVPVYSNLSRELWVYRVGGFIGYPRTP